MRFEGHTHFFTVGGLIGTPACRIPTCGRTWQPIAAAHRAVGMARHPWRSRCALDHRRQLARLWIDHARRRAVRTEGAFVPPPAGPAGTERRAHQARADDPSRREERSRRAARCTGGTSSIRRTWRRRPTRIASSCAGSKGELGIAKSGYVESRCGWFSDRSVCYLASGRPVIAQDTGFGAYSADRRGSVRVQHGRRSGGRDGGGRS